MATKPSFLMLANDYDPKVHAVGGWYMSEKLDGIRCFWDGGITRGMRTREVPWAGVIDPKTGQPKKKVKEIASGLWSRYGNPIIAPDWFLNRLPCVPLDGELWAGRGGFQVVTSAARKDRPDDAQWKQLQYGVFSTPDMREVLADRYVRDRRYHCDLRGAFQWVRDQGDQGDWTFVQGRPSFAVELATLNEWVEDFNDTTFLIQQTKLPMDDLEAHAVVKAKRESIILEGGEGLFLRAPDSVWIPCRTHQCLKYKGSIDDEATVVGFTSGRKTDSGSKFLGLIGALIVEYRGKRLELSGLTNEEREFSSADMEKYARDFPGQDMPSSCQGRFFKVGDTVTFTYRELTKDGIPKEARYLRKRNENE